LHTQLFITHSDDAFKSNFYIVPCGISEALVWSFGCVPEKPKLPASVPGGGAIGPFGPRIGSSSGILPGNSSGRDGSPGSCIGVGTSGRGLPGGIPGGGSVGVPGVAGGISGGSIGIDDNGEIAAMFRAAATGTGIGPYGVWHTASML
jgi:hypothetical protein